jgi:hypothetical protein
MARPPKGKPLTFRPLRLDDDVWAECQRLGKEHGTINEGLRAQLRLGRELKPPTWIPVDPAQLDPLEMATGEKAPPPKRGPRPKGDKNR